MAEFIMKRLARREGLEEYFEIASAATSAEELGNPVYPLARQVLAEHGIGCPGKTARLLQASDYDYYDMLIGMDSENIAEMRRILPPDTENKISRLLDHTPADDTKHHQRDIDDPWYTRKFNIAWDDIYTGCQALMELLKEDEQPAD